MLRFKSLLKSLTAVDLMIIVFGLFLSLLNILYYNKIADWPLHVLYNFIVIVFVIVLAYIDKNNPSVFSTQLHFWYLVPVVFLSFKELYFMIDPIRDLIYDDALIAIDRFLFGDDPTTALHVIANPILTELLQLVYQTFFFLPVILGIELLLSKDRKSVV